MNLKVFDCGVVEYVKKEDMKGKGFLLFPS